MKLMRLAIIPAAVGILALGACSSDDTSRAGAAPTPSHSTEAPGALTCPTEVPASTTQADWTLTGTTGSVDVVGATADKAPLITVQTPFAVSETKVETIKPGTGADITSESLVSFCYEGVNGRDGKTFDNSYERGEPIQFTAAQLVPGFTKALVGQKVGASVAVAVAPADGYPSGTPDGSIRGGDTIVFALTILAAE